MVIRIVLLKSICSPLYAYNILPLQTLLIRNKYKALLSQVLFSFEASKSGQKSAKGAAFLSIFAQSPAPGFVQAGQAAATCLFRAYPQLGFHGETGRLMGIALVTALP
ncbi:MAG: hypothetical protein NTX59_05445 [Elusimicrobia bacterium]|nr:hypothetical protein [Elusimicrobiota bacterium]